MDPKWPVVTTNHHCFSNQCKWFRILIGVNDFYTEDGKRLSWLFLSGPSCMISNKNIDPHQVTTSETISYSTECTLQLGGIWEKLKQVLKSFPKQNPPIEMFPCHTILSKQIKENLLRSYSKVFVGFCKILYDSVQEPWWSLLELWGSLAEGTSA